MQQKTKKRLKRTGFSLLILLLVLLIPGLWYHLDTAIRPPGSAEVTDTAISLQQTAPGMVTAGNNWLKQSNTGLWEMYLEGEPFQRGYINGKLSKALIDAQEQAFIDQIRTMIPSDGYLHFLKYFIYWFNRDLDEYIPEEYRREIYGISLSASDRFKEIGSAYHRMLNYHSAHDIGHALQDLSLVGCTSFGVWGDHAADGGLIIGRNFDFYMGEAFAANKIVCFEKPSEGFGFMMVTWGGMIGNVSGMNEAGLTVTINAAKSEIPFSARTPISILAREILQYASTIGEAYAIAKKRETFVSESLLIGSGRENRAAIIEKSPSQTELLTTTGSTIACTNHFRSTAFSKDPLNQKNIRESASLYRYRRLLQCLSSPLPLDPAGVAKILRDREGLNGEPTGYGNEKAINQLIAHHSVIFQPGHLKAWVSTHPWQSGKYVCYDLYEIFHKFAGLKRKVEIIDSSLTIEADPFLLSHEYSEFLKFKALRIKISRQLQTEPLLPLSGSLLNAFQHSNPWYYEVYSLAGDYYFKAEQWQKARDAYARALTKVIPVWKDKEIIIKKMVQCNANLLKHTE